MTIKKKSVSLLALLAVTVVTMSACSTNPYYDNKKAHHTPAGFRNIYIDDKAKGFSAFMKWKWEQLFKDIPDADAYNFPIDKSHHAVIRSNKDRPSLTWIGHATFLVQLEGINILTDPQFSERASPVSWAGPRRAPAPAMTVDELPEIDAVIISHDHYDSLDEASIRQLAAHNKQGTLHFFVPLGFKAWLNKLGLENIRVIELDWGESHQLGPVTFTAEPVQHWGKRTLFDAFERLWASWVMETNKQRIFFAGDTGYAQHFKDIGSRYGHFDVALIPIGAYAPRWFMRSYHVNPTESVKMHQDLRSRYSVGMHWGTFILTDEPLDEPPVKLAEALRLAKVPPSEFEVYTHGESRFLEHLFHEK